MRWFYTLVGVLWCLAWLVGPAHGFVERLNPYAPDQPSIPCHQMRYAIIEFIAGTYSGATIKSALLDQYGLVAWSAHDDADFTNLATLVNAQTGTANKTLIALRVESMCAGAESAFPHVDTPNEFRTLLGIAPQ